ncbi:PIN-like domain-containing protein [Rhodococcus sp. 14-2483-1-2]|uniref:PIN-like domain-containing protein n=1 Tax=Rhodococcus sp. 14-2483-1-2 TaxID=2023147 RepID=UPI000B9C0FBB|nr:PIN-like domain-containing protein [Rhodococcus sp. 14-2483-1-2]OZF29435.1 hypothetical protein CH295_18005 [Rhodococcus sp. 14-2483-1-2]
MTLVWNVLNRNHDADFMSHLYNAIQKSESFKITSGTNFAIGFDTNAIFRVGLNGTKGADAIDYLRTIHNGPVVLPGQCVQELWNNSLAAVEPQAKKISKAFANLQNETTGIHQALGAAGQAVQDAVENLLIEHKDWVDPASHETFATTLEALLDVATCQFVPRSHFYSLSQIRKETKTPPGFRDHSTNHGDFFVWADFLYSLATIDTSTSTATVFVTNDVKTDWSRNGVAHPILASEATSVTGTPFVLWTVPDFQNYVNELST